VHQKARSNAENRRLLPVLSGYGRVLIVIGSLARLLYGHLIARNDRVYPPGASQLVCTVQTAHAMVRSGWLMLRDGRYEITPKGHQAVELALR
jgi:hypothetical protein